MKIEIDQSGKIENTNKLTVVAYSNSKQKAILITSGNKKKIQAMFRKSHQPRIFVYKLFAVAIFVLIKDDMKNIDQIIIDREYVGYENLIKQFIIDVCRKNKIHISKDIIHFHLISKKSNAHKVALCAYKKKRADLRLSVQGFNKIT